MRAGSSTTIYKDSGSIEVHPDFDGRVRVVLSQDGVQRGITLDPEEARAFSFGMDASTVIAENQA